MKNEMFATLNDLIEKLKWESISMFLLETFPDLKTIYTTGRILSRAAICIKKEEFIKGYKLVDENDFSVKDHFYIVLSGKLEIRKKVKFLNHLEQKVEKEC